MRWRIALIVVAALAGALLTVVLAWGGGEKPAETTPRSIQGPQVRLDDLTYVITDVRLLNRNKPVDAPYLVNAPVRPKGRAYLGVFLKIYNNNADKALPSAPGYLLEPQKNPSYVVYQQWSESPYRLDPGTTVPAGGELPVPGSSSAAGPITGGLLLFVVRKEMTDAQPLRLIINIGTQL